MKVKEIKNYEYICLPPPEDHFETREEYFKRRYFNQPLAFLCFRFWYRGIVTQVGQGFIVLSNPFAIDNSGAATGETARREEPLPSDWYISLDAIEGCGQMVWTFKDYDKSFRNFFEKFRNIFSK